MKHVVSFDDYTYNSIEVILSNRSAVSGGGLDIDIHAGTKLIRCKKLTLDEKETRSGISLDNRNMPPTLGIFMYRAREYALCGNLTIVTIIS